MHFSYVSEKLSSLCQITIGWYSIQPFNWVRFEPEMYREWENFCPLSSAPCGAARATLTARFMALANWELKLRNCFPHSCPSRIAVSNSAWSSSHIPAAAVIFLACMNLGGSIWILEFISEWLHIRGEKFWAFRSNTSFCRAMILARWLHTLWINSTGSVHKATFNDSSSHSASFFQLHQTQCCLYLPPEVHVVFLASPFTTQPLALTFGSWPHCKWRASTSVNCMDRYQRGSGFGVLLPSAEYP